MAMVLERSGSGDAWTRIGDGGECSVDSSCGGDYG